MTRQHEGKSAYLQCLSPCPDLQRTCARQRRIVWIFHAFHVKNGYQKNREFIAGKFYCTIMGAGASHHYSVRPKHQLRKY